MARRRKLLASIGSASLAGLAGCASIFRDGDDDEDEIQDTDGDGVIDSEDYAPRDPDIQREEQVKGDSTPEETRTPTEEPTDTPTKTETETPTETKTPTDTPTETTQIVAQEQLISRWPFQEGFEDVAGDNDASPDYGSPTIGTHHGKTSTAFDGTDGLRLGSGSDNPELSIMSLESGPSSIAGWVYFDQGMGYNDPNRDPPRAHILRIDAEYHIDGMPTDDDGEINMRLAIPGIDGDGRYISNNRTGDNMIVSTQDWHHFAYVIEPEDSFTFYIDGQMEFQDNTWEGHNPNRSVSWSDQTIGNWYGTGNPDWYAGLVGKLSDLRIYDISLSSDEVNQIYNNTK